MEEAAALWALEHEFWTGGAEFFEKNLAPDCVMCFPAPVGVLSRDAVVRSIAAAARWRSVAFTDRRELHPAAGTTLLVYAVEARRDGAPATYRAIASSLYVRRGETWCLAFHQQSPDTPAPG